LVALTLAMGMMVIVLGLLLTYTVALVAQQRQTEEAWAASQAYYAAEAGLAVLRQSGRSPASGSCGRAHYQASASGGEMISVGEVETSGGHVVRRSLSFGKGVRP
jgi:cytochrome c553